jgi:hypothetical protein
MNLEKTVNLFNLLGVFLNSSKVSKVIRIILILFSFRNIFHVLLETHFQRLNPLMVVLNLSAYTMLSLNLIIMTTTSVFFSAHKTEILSKLSQLDFILSSDLKLKNQKKEKFDKYFGLVFMLVLVMCLPMIHFWIFQGRTNFYILFLECLSYFLVNSSEICFVFLVDLVNYRLRSLASLSELLSGKSFILSLHSKLFSISRLIDASFSKVISMIIFGQCMNAVVFGYWAFTAFLVLDYSRLISKLNFCVFLVI